MTVRYDDSYRVRLDPEKVRFDRLVARLSHDYTHVRRSVIKALVRNAQIEFTNGVIRREFVLLCVERSVRRELDEIAPGRLP